MISDDFYGDRFRWFVGVVKDVGDDRSRVRVRIFGIHHTEDTTKVSDGDLPWALVLYPTTGGQAGGGNASHNLVPGSWVVGFFCDGIDSQQPIVFGVINGGAESTNSSPAQNSNSNPLSPSQTASNPTEAAAADTNNPAGSPTTTQLTGDSNVHKVYNYFWEKIKQEGSYSGDLKCIVSAICGNLQGESGNNINPQAYNPNDKGEPSYGIAQWRAGKYDRYTPLLKFCGISAPVKPPNLPPLEKQLDFMWHELHTSERSAYNKLIASTTIQDAVAGIVFFERDDSYKKIGGTWTVDRNGSSYKRKLENARKVLASASYSGGASS
jgi:hypothetical protein